MREVEILREIALSVEHLKAIRRTKNEDDSDKTVVKAINDAGSKLDGWEELRPGRLNLFRYGRDSGKLGALTIILQAVDSVMGAENARITLAEMDRRYRHKLGPLLNQRISQLFQGQELGQDSALAVRGAWQFFYLSPIDRNRKRKPEYRGIGVFVHQATPTARTVDFFVLSKHSRWEGEAFINQSHLYLMCSDPNRKEAAFFLMNKPRVDQPFLAGVGAGLERWVDRPIRPALGFFCFGMKWEPEGDPPGAPNEEARNRHLDETVKRAVEKEHIEEHEEHLLRSRFCQTYSAADIKRKSRSLYDYVQQVHVNRENTFQRDARPWLYLEWPG